MTMIRFTKFIEKVLDHTKTRTVRKKRKCNCGASKPDITKLTTEELKLGLLKYKRENCICQIEKGDTLQVYALFKIGEAIVGNVQKFHPASFTHHDAQLDGFNSREEFVKGIEEMHNLDNLFQEEFRIIDFEPNWKPQKIVNLSLEDFAARMTKEQWIEFMKEGRDQPREWPPKTDKEVYLKHKKGFD